MEMIDLLDIEYSNSSGIRKEQDSVKRPHRK